ncbi:MAG: hypothetical protein ABSG50_10420 [Opitutaceae bacterium]|jgi:hypothetical protein
MTETHMPKTARGWREWRQANMVRTCHAMRKIGKRRYVLRYGVLLYGGSVFLVGTFLLSIEERDWLSPLQLVALLGVSSLLGLVDGLFRWRIFERRCSQLIGVSDKKTAPIGR